MKNHSTDYQFARRREFYAAVASHKITIPHGLDAKNVCDAFVLGSLTLDQLKPGRSKQSVASIVERVSNNIARGLLEAPAERLHGKAEARRSSRTEDDVNSSKFDHLHDAVRAGVAAGVDVATQIIAAAYVARSGGPDLPSMTAPAKAIVRAGEMRRQGGTALPEPTGLAAAIIAAGKKARGEAE